MGNLSESLEINKQRFSLRDYVRNIPQLLDYY